MRATRFLALGISVALLAAGCAANEGGSNSNSQSPTASQLNGTIQGVGASSLKAAQDAWTANFQTAHSAVTINYSPDGSGAGITAITNGGANFAGSDEALTGDKIGVGLFKSCADDSSVLNLPVYVSPIAIIFNIAGVTELILDADTLAGIFAGTITQWNDAAITALNPGVNLPNAAINPVHRSDKSGTTQNFTETLSQTAPGVWTHQPSGEWPLQTGEAAKGTSGVVGAVKSGANTIGYADESQIQGATSVTFLNKAGEKVKPSAEASAKIVDASPKANPGENDWALKLDRTAAGYPFVLVSYFIVCEKYNDANTAELVRSYVGYVASKEGQAEAAKAAGSAPLSTKLQEAVAKSVSSIK